MRGLLTYVESETGVAPDLTTFAWVFDDEFWGLSGQGLDEAAALVDLGATVAAAGSGPVEFGVAERITGDELAFARDRQPATEHQRELTVGILEAVRAQSIALIAGATPAELDYDDPERTLPTWASWRTLRQMAWHVANTESRYYLPELGLGYRHAEPDLLDELAVSGSHVRAIVAGMPLDLVNADGTWTSAKLLRRLAWHERSELVTMRRMAGTARERAGLGWAGPGPAIRPPGADRLPATGTRPGPGGAATTLHPRPRPGTSTAPAGHRRPPPPPRASAAAPRICCCSRTAAAPAG